MIRPAAPVATTAEMVEQGRVCPVRLFVPSPEDVYLGSAADAYARHCPGKRVLVFCASASHAEDVAADFCDARVSATTMLGHLSETERKERIEAFRSGRVSVLVTVAMLLEVRWPEVEAVIIFAPTNSRTRFMQQATRASVPRFAAEMPTLTSDQRRAAIAASDKPHATVIDLGGNVYRLGVEGLL